MQENSKLTEHGQEDFQAYGKVFPYEVRSYSVFSKVLDNVEIAAMHACDIQWTPLQRIESAHAFAENFTADASIQATLTVVGGMAVVVLILCTQCVKFVHRFKADASVKASDRVTSSSTKATNKQKLEEEEFEEEISSYTLRFLSAEMEAGYVKCEFAQHVQSELEDIKARNSLIC